MQKFDGEIPSPWVDWVTDLFAKKKELAEQLTRFRTEVSQLNLELQSAKTEIQKLREVLADHMKKPK